MNHKPSVIMVDQETRLFQRCWECGARRTVASLGPGLWDKGPSCGPEEEVVAPTKPEPTRAELLEELFKQT